VKNSETRLGVTTKNANEGADAEKQPHDDGLKPLSDRRAYHRAYYWNNVERRRAQAREAHFRRQLRKWFGEEIPRRLTHLLRK
jgi:hypothetical protein